MTSLELLNLTYYKIRIFRTKLASFTVFLASSSSTLADTLVGPCFELAPDCLGGDGLDDDDLRDLDFDLDLRLSRDLERRRWDFFFDSL